MVKRVVLLSFGAGSHFMDLYFLNFKRILVVLTAQSMRQTLLSLFEEQEIDVNVKFVDSYYQAVMQINANEHDPYDHIVLNLSFSNQKLNDFVEFITPSINDNSHFLLEYTQDGSISTVEILDDNSTKN